MTPSLKPAIQPDDEAVHEYFGLSYCTHLVLPRVLLQNMPGWWQAEFVHLMEKYEQAVKDVPQAKHYDVRAATQHEVSDLDDAQRKLAGVSREWVGPDGEETSDDDVDGEWRYYDENTDELESWERVLVPCADPLPHYQRGRTRVQLNPITRD